MKQILIAATSLLALGSAAASTTVFEETWDADAAANGSVLNFNGFTQWDVTDGFVDLLVNGGFGLSCNTPTGGCIDADGSGSSPTGMELTTKSMFLFEAGRDYTLNITYSGNQRGGSDSLSFSVGSLFSDSVTSIMSMDPFTTYVGTFTPTIDTMAALVISVPGPLDNIGPIVDDILLTVADVGPAPVPVPAALPLFLGSAGVFAALRRRRT